MSRLYERLVLLFEKHGPFALMAGFLVYELAVGLRAEMHDMRVDHAVIRRYLWAACLNEADDPVKVARCNAAENPNAPISR